MLLLGLETFRGIDWLPRAGQGNLHVWRSGEPAGGEYRMDTKGSRGSKKEKGPRPKGIKTRIWTLIYVTSAPQRELCFEIKQG